MSARPAEPRISIALSVVADYGQIYIYDPAHCGTVLGDPRRNVYLEALADATKSHRFVGSAGGLVDLMTPGQYNSNTPMLVEVWAAEPVDDRDEWQHEVDLDLDIPSGQLVFEASGGSGSTTATVPSGRYRARVSGRGFTARGFEGANGQDSYRLRLWLRSEATDPRLRKSWSGWEQSNRPSPSGEDDAAVAETIARIVASTSESVVPAVSGPLTTVRHQSTISATEQTIFEVIERPQSWLGVGGNPLDRGDGWFNIDMTSLGDPRCLVAGGRLLRADRNRRATFTWSWVRAGRGRWGSPESEREGTRFPHPSMIVDILLRPADTSTIVDVSVQDVPMNLAADVSVLWAYYVRRLSSLTVKQVPGYHPWLTH